MAALSKEQGKKILSQSPENGSQHCKDFGLDEAAFQAALAVAIP